MLRRLKLVGFYVLFCVGFVTTYVTCLFDRLFQLRLAFPRNVKRLAKRQAWCIARLTEAGALPADAEVLSYDVIPFKQGEVFRSELASLVVTYRHADQQQTMRCVVKFAPTSGSVANRTIFTLQANHIREVGFYRELAAASKALQPTVYYARAGTLTSNLCVIMAYLDQQTEYGEEEGCPADAALRAVSTLARFHAAHWRTDDTVPRFPPAVPAAAIAFSCSLAWGKRHRTLRRLAERSWTQGNTAQTLIHGDARVGNMLFGPEGSVTLIDWQAARWGRAAFDLAYFMLLSLPTEDRRTNEEALILHYHQALRAAGITACSLEALRDDYQHACLMTYALLVLPLLSGEVSLAADNADRAISNGLMWVRRIIAKAGEMTDEDWLQSHYDMSHQELVDTVEAATLEPPWLNRGARLVAEAYRAEATVARGESLL